MTCSGTAGTSTAAAGRAGREAAIALAAVIPAGMRRPGRAAPLWGPSERARSDR